MLIIWILNIDLGLSATDNIQAECALGWIHYNNSCFFFSSDAYDWFQAQSSCRAHNARLAEPADKLETDYLNHMVISFHRDRGYWIGGRDDVVEGIWQWSSSDEIITYQPWYVGEPNNTGGDEDCLETEGMWNDSQCTSKLYYVCQRRYPGVETEIIG